MNGRTALVVSAAALMLQLGCGADRNATAQTSPAAPLLADSPLAAQVRALNSRLLQLHASVRDSGSADASSTQAAAVIQDRAAALSALTAAAPAEALTLAFAPELLAELAIEFPASAAFLESHATLTGPLEYWTEDAADLKSGHTLVRMSSGPGRTVDLYFAGQQPAGVKSGDTVEVTGVIAGPAMAVASAVLSTGVASTSSARALTATTTGGCSSTGVQNTAVLLVTFPGVSLPSAVTPQSLGDIFFNSSTGPSLDGFLRDASYGQTSAAGGVFGPFTLTGTYTSCSDVGGAVLNDAIAAAVASGVNLQSYSRVFLVFPDAFNCGWAGFASNSCSTTTPSGSFNASVAYIVAGYATTRANGVNLAAHELGHNMSLLHSGLINGGASVLGPLTSPGTLSDIGDYWSALGEDVLGLYPAPQKAEVLGWMAPSTNYQVVQASGTYTLQPLETSPAGLQALKVQRGTGNASWLWIEYRQPLGSYDSTLSTQPFTGALVHYEDANTLLGHTYLPNFTPSVTSGFSPALAAGQTWTDAYSNLSLTVNSATPAGLSVTVAYGAVPCAHSSPTLAISPANPSGAAGAPVGYTVTVTNNDTAGCSASTFSLAAGQPAGWSTSLSAPTLSLGPGQSASATMTLTSPAGAAPATYAVGATASSGAYQGSGSASCTIVSAPALAVSVSVPSTIYSAKGNTAVPITATVLSGGSPLPGATVAFTLTRPDGTVVTQSATATSSGSATWSFRPGSKASTGAYSVSARVSAGSGQATSNTVSFTVQ
ncbi:MAG TPA: NEW3 domain-containing protein [Trebonia sp.]